MFFFFFETGTIAHTLPFSSSSITNQKLFFMCFFLLFSSSSFFVWRRMVTISQVKCVTISQWVEKFNWISSYHAQIYIHVHLHTNTPTHHFYRNERKESGKKSSTKEKSLNTNIWWKWIECKQNWRKRKTRKKKPNGNEYLYACRWVLTLSCCLLVSQKAKRMKASTTLHYLRNWADIGMVLFFFIFVCIFVCGIRNLDVRVM